MLTDEQSERLEKFPENARVVGIDRNCPLVRQHDPAFPEINFRIVRVLPNGRTVPARADVTEKLRYKLP